MSKCGYANVDPVSEQWPQVDVGCIVSISEIEDENLLGYLRFVVS